MSRQKAHHTKQFKLDAINYRKEHPDLTQVECASNLGICVNTLARWEAQLTKPRTTTTRDSDFSKELLNILNE